MRTMRKTALLLLSMVLVLSCVSAVSAADANPYSLYAVISDEAVPSAKEGEPNTSHIKLRDGYLYLPSSTDMSKVKLCFEGEGELKIKADKGGGKAATFRSGEAVNLKYLFEACNIENYRYPAIVSNSAGQLAYINIMKSENLPTIFLTVPSGNLDYVNSIKGNQEAGTAFIIDVDGKVLYNAGLKKIKGRGNATWGGGGTGKKPYNITLEDKADIIPGAGAGKKYCLLNSSASKQDETYIINQVVLEAATKMPGNYYPVHTRMIEFYCNGDYRGLYEITEKIDTGSSLVDIPDQEDFTADGPDGAQVQVTDKNDSAIAAGVKVYAYWSSAAYQVDEPDITGGYIVEGDGYYQKENCWFVTKNGRGYTVKRPEFATREQVAYIAEYVQDYENAVYSATGFNDKGKHYSEYIDMDSMASRFILENFFYCREQLGNSTYISKPAGNDTKLYFGPMWDYENVMASYAWIRNGGTTEYNPYNTLIVGTGMGKTLITKGDFMERLYDINEKDFLPLIDSFLGEPAFPTNGISINKMAEAYKISVAMDIERWKKQDIWEAELNKYREWMQNRINYWTGSNNVKSLFDESNLMGATLKEENGTLVVELRGVASGFKWYKMSEDKKKSSEVIGAYGMSFTPAESGTYYAVVSGMKTSENPGVKSGTLTTNPVTVKK